MLQDIKIFCDIKTIPKNLSFLKKDKRKTPSTCEKNSVVFLKISKNSAN